MTQKDEFRNNMLTGQMNLVFQSRMLWRDLATWLNTYMTTIYGGLGNHDAIGEKLYRLPLDHGAILKLAFGDQEIEYYINLLSTYIITLQSLFIAQMTGDTNAIDQLMQQSSRIIDQKSAFLDQINPYWEKDVWKSLLNKYHGLVIETSTALLSNQQKKHVDVFDRLLSASSTVGDYFSEGIFKYVYHGDSQVRLVNG